LPAMPKKYFTGVTPVVCFQEVKQLLHELRSPSDRVDAGRRVPGADRARQFWRATQALYDLAPIDRLLDAHPEAIIDADSPIGL